MRFESTFLLKKFDGKNYSHIVNSGATISARQRQMTSLKSVSQAKKIGAGLAITAFPSAPKALYGQ